MAPFQTLQNGRQESAEFRQMSYEQFLVETDGLHVEWVDGKVVAMPPISGEEQSIAKLVLLGLDVFVAEKKRGIVRFDPFQMKTGKDLPVRSPEIFFVATENLGRLKHNYLDGPADVAVELVREESDGRERSEKFYEYEKGGVREYWLIDPIRKKAEFYLLGADGFYQAAETPDGVFRSVVLPGFWLKVDWLFRSPLPTTLDLLKALELI